mmetsp:Transcript_31335/g.105518  ORF Transcript_31335/g.105518 Transcript_31335/m.105518 type:complete len:326 (-) Transcript_31335:1769-2746(-)
MPMATISDLTVGSCERFAKATAHLNLVESSACLSEARVTRAASAPISHKSLLQGSCADTADKTAQHARRVAASDCGDWIPAMTCDTAPSAINAALASSLASRHKAAQQCLTMSASRVWSMSIKAATTPASTIKETFASTAASLHNAAAHRIRHSDEAGVARPFKTWPLESAMMAGMAAAETVLSLTASPLEKLNNDKAHASRISAAACPLRTTTASTPPCAKTCSWCDSSTRRCVKAERPCLKVDKSHASLNKVTKAGTQPSATMARRPAPCCESRARADAQSCVVATSRGQRRQMLHSAVTPPSCTSRGRFAFSMVKRIVAEAM